MSDSVNDNTTLSTDHDAYPKQLPTFANEEEIREFWSTHDSTPYVEQMEDVTSTPPPGLGSGAGRPGTRTRRRPPAGRMDLVSLRLPVDMIDAVKDVAAQRHLPYQTLMRSWIGERLNEERRRLSEHNAGSR